MTQQIPQPPMYPPAQPKKSHAEVREEKKRLLNPAQLAASAGGAVASGLLGAKFGDSGTVIGLASGSVISGTATSLIDHGITRARHLTETQLATIRTRPLTRPPVTGAHQMPSSPTVEGGIDRVTAPRIALTGLIDRVTAPRIALTGLPWRQAAVTAGVLAVAGGAAAFGFVTAGEAVTGTTLSGAVNGVPDHGTMFSSSTHSPSPAPTPGPSSPAATPTGTSSVTVSPSAPPSAAPSSPAAPPSAAPSSPAAPTAPATTPPTPPLTP